MPIGTKKTLLTKKELSSWKGRKARGTTFISAQIDRHSKPITGLTVFAYSENPFGKTTQKLPSVSYLEKGFQPLTLFLCQLSDTYSSFSLSFPISISQDFSQLFQICQVHFYQNTQNPKKNC